MGEQRVDYRKPLPKMAEMSYASGHYWSDLAKPDLAKSVVVIMS